jgi:hypothetical protein
MKRPYEKPALKKKRADAEDAHAEELFDKAT